jgi:phosphoglycolate phosphatase-like HAD superfamily hydrolase
MLLKLSKKIILAAFVVLSINPLNAYNQEIQALQLSRANVSELKFPKAVFIDWDNTISHVWPPLLKIMNKTLHKFGKGPLSMEEFLNLPDINMPQAEQIKYMFQGTRQDVVDVYWQNYHDHHAKEPLEIDKYAAALLAYLKSNGVFIAAISNQEQKILEGNIAKSGLKEYFDIAVGSIRDQPEKNKPSVGAVKRALKDRPSLAEKIGQVQDDWWFIGDSEVDMKTAINAKCLPVWVTQYAIKKLINVTEEENYPKAFEVESLSQLLTTLKQLKE